MKLKLFKALFQLTRNVVSWIGSNFTLELIRPVKDYHGLISRLEKVYLTRGPDYFIFYIKSVRTIFMSYLSGNVRKIDGIGCTHDGLPKIFGSFIKDIRQEAPPRGILQMLMTILFMSRALHLGVLPDYTPITAPPSGSTSDFGEYTVDF